MRNIIPTSLLEIFEKADAATLKIALCHHEWEILSGECLYRCHKAEEALT